MRISRQVVLKKLKAYPWAAGLVLLVILGGAAGLLIVHHKHVQDPKSQMKTLVAQVGKIIELPTNEDPTIGTVTNAASVQKQPFFIHAQQGDKVLIYATHKWAILYRPGAHKIINVGPINGTVAYTQFTAAVRNGTPQPASLNKVIGSLGASFPNSKVTEQSVAHRSDFPTSIVVAVNEKDQDLAAQIADALGMQVGNLPIGEQKSPTDILILIGQDYKQ